MDPAIAFALACNIVQAAQWCYQAGQTVYQLYKDGTTPTNRSLGELTQHLTTALERLRNVQDDVASTAEDRQLKDLAEKCFTIATDLQNKLTDLKKKCAGGKRKKLLGAARVLWEKEDIKRLENNLEDTQRLLHTAGLVHDVLRR